MRFVRALLALGLVLTALAGPAAGMGGAASRAQAIAEVASAGTPASPLRRHHAFAAVVTAGSILVVRHVSPRPGAVEVPRGGLLAVEFSRPMVPLSAIGAAG